MTITVNVNAHITFLSDEAGKKLDVLLDRVTALGSQGVSLMALIDEMRFALTEANATTNASAAVIADIQADIAALLDKIANGLNAAEAAEVITALTAHNDALAAPRAVLEGVAAQYPPV